MKISNWLGIVGLGLALALTGCSDDGGDGDPDGGPMMDTGMNGGDGGGNGGGIEGNLNEGAPMAQASDTGGAADLSCMGMRTEPMPGGSPADFTFQVNDFMSGNAVEGVCVRFYSDNMLPMSDSCMGTMTPANGQVTVSDVPESWYAYRIFPEGTKSVGSLQRNEAAPMAGGTAVGNAVSESTLGLIPTILGFSRVPGTAVVSGTFQDCADEPILGLQMRLARSDGTYIPEGSGGSDPHYRYFMGDGGTPSPTAEWSQSDGLFAAANIPVNTEGEEVFVEAWGRTSMGGDMEVLACEKTRLIGDQVSIINLGPLRSDGPSCPGLN